ncbi:MAG TPA: immunoglobulin-like domain-containing protein [Pyrinomonadaceae bacterium]|nr:immunoglobulin-like domain-containing protein [Pyrinomonadaceae bacterium]
MKADLNLTNRLRFLGRSNSLRMGIVLSFVLAVIVTSFLTSSTATSSNARRTTEDQISNSSGLNEKSVLNRSSFPFPERIKSRFLPMLTPQASSPEEIATFAADCITPKSHFTVGDTVCLKATGTFGSRKIYWIDPDGGVVQVDSATEGTQTISARGNWRGYLVSGDDGTLRVAAAFSVSDPQQPRVDLSVVQSIADGTHTAGGFISYQVVATNQGPDTANDVEVTEQVPNNSTLVSSSQDAGPTFSCNAGTSETSCTIASLAPGASAAFTFVYQINSSTAVGTEILNTAEIASTTEESHPADNTFDLAGNVISGSEGATCTLDCPNNITVTANTTQGGTSGAIVNFGGAEAFGDCGSLSPSIPSGSFFPVGSTTVVVSSSTGGGSCSFVVTVTDDQPPNISCPANVNTHLTDCQPSTIDPGTPSASPNGVEVTGERNDGQPLDAPYPVGTTIITWTATDASARTDTCTQTVTVTSDDNVPPTITAPADVTIATPDGTSGSCGLVVGETELGSPDANDNCTVNVTRSGVPTGNFFPVGTTAITYTATDGSGHTATAVQHVIVSDGTAPIIVAPPDASYVCPNEVPAGNPNQAHGANENLPDGGPPTDNCGVPTITVADFTSGSGSASSPLIISRVFTATDSAGNTATATQTITVIDPTPPTITLNGPDPLVVECHSTLNDPGATANDNCGGNFAATATSNVNSNVVGNYTITYNASDAAGNAATPVVRNVSVVDTTAPTINLNGQTPSLWPANHRYRTFQLADFISSVTDSCDTTLNLSSVVIEQVTSDESENGNGDGNTLSDIIIGSDCKSVQLRAERNGGGDGRVYTIKFRVKDAAGNTSTATVNVLVPADGPGQTPVNSGPQYVVNGSCP